MVNIINSSIRNIQEQKIKSLSIDKVELIKLCQILQERSNAAGDIEVENYQQNKLSAEEFEANKVKLKEAFNLSITGKGSNNQQIFGPINEVLNSPNFPEKITSVYINSETILKSTYNWVPRNVFELFLDFTKPGVFDFNFMPSTQTPNGSIFKVSGYEATWVNGLFHEITNSFKEKSSFLSRVHSQSVYDILLMVIGMPFSFWVCFKCSKLSFFPTEKTFLINAIYVYIYLLTLWFFRILFQYLRWICPLVEFKCPKNNALKHKIILGTIFLGIITAVIYDFLKYVVMGK